MARFALALTLGLLLATVPAISAAATAAESAKSAAAPQKEKPAPQLVPEDEYLGRLRSALPEFFDPARYTTTPKLFRANIPGKGWVERPLAPLRDVPPQVTLLFNAALFQLSDKAYYQPHVVRKLLEAVVGYEVNVRGRLANLTPIKMYAEQVFSAGKVLSGLAAQNPTAVKENLAMAWYRTLYGSPDEARRYVERAQQTGLRDEEDFVFAADVYERIGDKAAAKAVLETWAKPRP